MIPADLDKLRSDIVGTDLAHISADEAKALCPGLPGNSSLVCMVLMGVAGTHEAAGNHSKAHACMVLFSRVLRIYTKHRSP